MRRTRRAALALATLSVLFSPLIARADPPQYAIQWLDNGGFERAAPSDIYDGVAVGGGRSSTISGARALLWEGPGNTASDVTPPGYSNTYFTSRDDQYSVGGGGPGATHAWQRDNVTGAVVDLHTWGVPSTPSDTVSVAWGVNGNFTVGFTMAGFRGPQQAALWDHTTTSYVNLQPVDATSSIAQAVAGNTVAGWVSSPASDNQTHATLWDALTHATTDIHPGGLGLQSSEVDAMGTAYMGGFGTPTDSSAHHALLWDRTSLTARDLNPVGMLTSQIDSLNDQFSVGYGLAASNAPTHALIWDNLTGVAFDLHSLFGPEYASYNSTFTGIDSAGNIAGWLGSPDGNSTTVPFVLRPITASVVPEAGTGTLLAIAVSLLFPLRRRRRQTKMKMCTLP